MTFFPAAGIIAILEPIIGSGIQVLWDGDREGFYAVNPGPSDGNPAVAPSVDPSIAYSSGNFGTNPTAGAICRISVKALRTIGSDECITVYTDPGPIVTKYVGLRGFTLNLLLESDQLGFPQEVLENIRIKLQRNSIRTSLRALAISIESIEPVQDVSATWDDRQVSAATLDLVCMMRVEDIDDTPIVGAGIIEHTNNPNDPPADPGPGPAFVIDGAGQPGNVVTGSTGELP